MNERIKIFLFVAVLGFLAGVIADVSSMYVLPWLMAVLPEFLKARYLFSGIAGACLTLVLLTVWAYVHGPSER